MNRLTLSPLNHSTEYLRLCVRQLASEQLAAKQAARDTAEDSALAQFLMAPFVGESR
jgi:hypothetical protein